MTHTRLSVFLTGCLFLLLPAAMFSQDSTLIDFKIKDQFDRVYTQTSWTDSIIVIIGSDRKGSEFSGTWSGAIKDSLNKLPGFTRVKFVGLSDLRGVPFFLKGYVRGRFPKDPENWVLMDWKGHFSKAYQFKEAHCNILIFDKRRQLIHQTAGTILAPEKLQQIINNLRVLLTNTQ